MEALKLLFLATFVEGFTEYVVPEGFKFTKYFALLVGVGAALAYNIDILGSLTGLQSSVPYVSQIISGLIIGRGSNYLNDIVSNIRGEN